MDHGEVEEEVDPGLTVVETQVNFRRVYFQGRDGDRVFSEGIDWNRRKRHFGPGLNLVTRDVDICPT